MQTLKVRHLVCTLAVLCLISLRSVDAQEGGNWRPANKTAAAVTGDIAFANEKIAINFATFTIAQIRRLKPEEITALFGEGLEASGTGNLYRLSIPGTKVFLHKNTLCGSDETQWLATVVSGRSLRLAFFSEPAMPVLTREAIEASSSLCGTYSYVR